MVDASAWGEAHALFAVSCLELLCLFYGYRLRKVTWEQLWILIVECFSYGCAATVPRRSKLCCPMAWILVGCRR